MKKEILPPKGFFKHLKSKHSSIQDTWIIDEKVAEAHIANMLKNYNEKEIDKLRQSNDKSLAAFEFDSISYDTRIFRHIFYASQYDDLRKKMGFNERDLSYHWKNFGIKEGRKASPAFDSVYYLAHNLDVERAFGRENYRAAISHWLVSGLSAQEGRRGSLNFDPKWYCLRYPDLWDVYGQHSNWLGAASHYVRFGWIELRLGSPEDDNTKRQPI